MHGTDDRPSNLAASNLESPSTTTLSLPTRRGTLNPNRLIEFAISRTCAGSDLRSLRTCDFKTSTEQGSIRSEGRMSFRRGLLPFSDSAYLAAACRRERPFAFKPSRRLSCRKPSFSVMLLVRASPYLTCVALSQVHAGIVAAPRALVFARSLS